MKEKNTYCYKGLMKFIGIKHGKNTIASNDTKI